MAGIQTSIGLMSGINYVEVVNQLMSIEQIPRDNLQKKTDLLQKQLDTLTGLTAYFMTASYMIGTLNKPTPFLRCDVSSSNPTILNVRRNGNPLPGNYQFTPIQVASSQQTIAKGVASNTQPLGKTGTITVGYGRTLENDVKLTDINGGDGFTKGVIRITDATGTTAAIDLRNAVTMNDVAKTINETYTISVLAEVKDDKLILTDLSSNSDKSKFAVTEVTNGSTAQSLGLLGGTSTNNGNGTITGSSIYKLGMNTALNSLNDGNGVAFDSILPDFSITCKDGTLLSIDFDKMPSSTDPNDFRRTETTIGDIINTINNANNNNGKVVATIGGPDGKSLVITDTTTGSIGDEATVITQISTRPVLRTLGFAANDSGTVLSSDSGSFTSRDLIGALDSPLMSSLNGGYGLSRAAPGFIEVQDREGNAALIEFEANDFVGINTVNQLMDHINQKLSDANVNLTIGFNEQKTGFKITDHSTTGSSNIIFKDHIENVGIDGGGNPILFSPDITRALGLNVDQAGNSASGVSVNLQTVSYNTELSKLNGGNGVNVTNGRLLVTNSLGQQSTVNINAQNSRTVGDLIDQINTQSTGIHARINDTGDGITLEDIVGGPGNISCWDADTYSSLAKDLKLAGIGTQNNASGRKYLDGSMTVRVNVVATDTLEDIAKKLNDAGGNFAASIIMDGSANPYRLTIAGNSTGAAAKMNIDLSAIGLTTENMAEAQDAIIILGDPNSQSAITLTSGSNTFRNIVSGMDITVAGISTTPITITSVKSNTEIKAALGNGTAERGGFVYNYNRFIEDLNRNTFNNTKTGEKGILYTDPAARAYQRELSNILLKTVTGIPGITSLRDIGISTKSYLQLEMDYDQDPTVEKMIDGTLQFVEVTKEEYIQLKSGTLVFDEIKFEELYERNPDGVRDFFYKLEERVDPEDSTKLISVPNGWAQMFMNVANSLSDTTDKTLGIAPSRMETLQRQVDDNNNRLIFMQERLDAKRLQMLKKFYAMEQAMAKMQSDMESISSMSTTLAT